MDKVVGCSERRSRAERGLTLNGSSVSDDLIPDFRSPHASFNEILQQILLTNAALGMEGE